MRDYRLLLEWQLRQVGRYLPMYVLIQVVVSGGTVLGFGYLIGDVTATQARYLVSGTPTVALLLMGLVALPQAVGQRKAQGQFEYMWSLPIPRMTYVAAQVSVWVIGMLPGAVAAQLLAAARFHYPLRPTLLLVPAVVLVAATGASIGFSIGLIAPTR
jgi:ABC-2 type transport system permease protein